MRTCANPLRPLLTATVLVWLVAIAPNDAGGASVPSHVLLSEIKPFREHPTDFVWVEVCNFGDTPVSIAGWRLQDGSGETYDVPSTTVPLPPDGCFVAVFPAGALPESLTNIPGVVVAQGDVAGRFLSGTHECALFRRDAEGVLDLVDYVAWEVRRMPQTPLADAASAAGLGRVYVGTYRALQHPGDGPRLRVGGTIGRKAWSMPHQPWQVYRPADSTPALRNVPGRPLGVGPTVGALVDPPVINFLWSGEPVVTLQIARDPAFTDLVLETQIDRGAPDTSGAQTAYPGLDAWPAGTFYWRVKNHWVNPRDGSPRETSWSDTEEFGVIHEPPPEPAPWPPGQPFPDIPLS